jgi:hypothetical protein
MKRLVSIDPTTCNALAEDDECFHIGEFTAHGGYEAGETNQTIMNLKKSPSSASSGERWWKQRAIEVWGDRLAEHLRLDRAADRVTFVPAPGSKPIGHADYDDRMLQVLQRMAGARNDLDIRSVLATKTARPAQHDGPRLSVNELKQTLEIDHTELRVPLRSTVLVIDDVITQGVTFRAIQAILKEQLGVRRVVGIFLARTVWPQKSPFDTLD